MLETARREGACRWLYLSENFSLANWLNFSENLSPPHASGGVKAESSLLDDAIGVVDPKDEKAALVSSCVNNGKSLKPMKHMKENYTTEHAKLSQPVLFCTTTNKQRLWRHNVVMKVTYKNNNSTCLMKKHKPVSK